MSQVPTLKDLPDIESVPILFHDGCAACLDIAATLRQAIPWLVVINLAKLRQFRKEALERGVERLPSLVVRDKVVAIAPHADLGELD